MIAANAALGASCLERSGPLLSHIDTLAAARDIEAVRLALLFLWPAVAYQVFDGLYFGSSFALRAAGDTGVPAAASLVLSWLVFVPLAHTLVFDERSAWIPGLPQAGLGALGGWLALAAYVMVLGGVMYLRWRSGRWQRINLWAR